MGDTTKISWADHTHNIWIGCQHAEADAPEERAQGGPTAPECDSCYAESFDHRLGGNHWGPDAPRRLLSDAYWKKPLKWNVDAERAGKRARVFCSSLADWAEMRGGDAGRVLDSQRARLWPLIRATPWLDWMLLTKRPENAPRLLPWIASPEDWQSAGVVSEACQIGDPWPNAWIGTTCGVRRSLWRIRELRQVPAALRFVSVEPLLEHITAEDWDDVLPGIDLMIVGDESGGHRRPCQPDWVRTAREAAARHGVTFHLKQLHLTDSSTRGERSGKGTIHLPIFDGRRHDAMPASSPVYRRLDE